MSNFDIYAVVREMFMMQYQAYVEASNAHAAQLADMNLQNNSVFFSERRLADEKERQRNGQAANVQEAEEDLQAEIEKLSRKSDLVEELRVTKQVDEKRAKAFSDFLMSARLVDQPIEVVLMQLSFSTGMSEDELLEMRRAAEEFLAESM